MELTEGILYVYDEGLYLRTRDLLSLLGSDDLGQLVGDVELGLDALLW